MTQTTSLRVTALTAILLLVGACTSAPKDAGFSEVNATIEERTGYQSAWTRGADEDALVASTTRALLADELTLEEAIQVAVLHNRHLQATFEHLGISRGQFIQAGVPENPVFAGEWRFFDAGTAFEALLSQDFISIFLIPLRREVQGHEFEATKLLVTEKIVHLVGDIKRAYNTYQGNKQLVEMLRQVVQATKGSYMISARLREAGNARQLDVFRERALYEEAKVQLNVAVEQLVVSREQLNALMGLWGAQTIWETPPRMADVPGLSQALQSMSTMPAERGVAAVTPEQMPTTMPGAKRAATTRTAEDTSDEARAEHLAGPPNDELVSSPPPSMRRADMEAVTIGGTSEPSTGRFEQVERMAVERSLDLAARRNLIEAQAARVKLHTITQIFPFLDAGVSEERSPASGEEAFGPGVNVPIPLWDWAQGTYPAELSRLRHELEAYAALATDIRAIARVAEARLQTTRSRAIYFRDVIMPLHAAVVAEAQLQYNAMQITPFELLLAKRQQIAAAAEYIAALMGYWRARSQLEELLDGAIPPGILPQEGAMTPPGAAMPGQMMAMPGGRRPR